VSNILWISSGLVVLVSANESKRRAFQGCKLSLATKPRFWSPGLRTTLPENLFEAYRLRVSAGDNEFLRRRTYRQATRHHRQTLKGLIDALLDTGVFFERYC